MFLRGWRKSCPRPSFSQAAVLPPIRCAFSVTTRYSEPNCTTRGRALAGLNGVTGGVHATSRLNSKSIRDFEFSSHLKISDEVRDALEENRPVVALESTIYTHGLPYPDNATLAVELEGILRDQGVTPATIGLVDGVAKIGMNALELHSLAAAGGRPATMKVSRRDLPYIIGMGLAGKKVNGGTTVAATMFLAEMCGIKIFATGGIGGVHRGGEDTMDVSADLNELGRTGMCVIASGCKSFLDIPRTLEYLETQGVTVATFSDETKSDVPFPAFYTRDSGVPSPLVAASPPEAAAILYAQQLLGPSFGSGFLLANPIPKEFAIPKDDIDSAIHKAIKEASKQGIRGHATTPFILAHIKEVTSGRSVVANRALIKSNVALAAQVAASFQTIQRSKIPDNEYLDPAASFSKVPMTQSNHEISMFEVSERAGQDLLAVRDEKVNPNVDIMVFGSLAVDLSCDYSPGEKIGELLSIYSHSPVLQTSNPSTITTTLGGVGHNVALAAQRACAGKLNVRLCSFIADDVAGMMAMNALSSEGLDNSGIRVKPPVEQLLDGSTRNNHTAQYVAFNDGKKDLFVAMADMSILDDRDYPIQPGTKDWKEISAAKWTIVDANLEAETIRKIAREARARGSKVVFEPVSTHKSVRIFATEAQNSSILNTFPNNQVDLASPNQYELTAMYAAAKENGLMEQAGWWDAIDAMGIPSSGARDRFVHLTNAKMTDAGIPVQVVQLLPFIPVILTKLGSSGVLHTELLLAEDPRLTDPASAPYILSRTTLGNSNVGGVYMRLFPPVGAVENVVSVNGVGDTFLGVLVAGLASGMQLDEKLINLAQTGAVLTLRSSQAVSPKIQGLLTPKV